MADAVESGGRARLVSELGRVQDLVRQLELQLRAPADAASVDLCRRLVHQIVALTDRSIGMLHSSPDLGPSPLSATGTGSPISSDAASDHHPFRPATASPKKRKATARWTSQQVRVSAAGGGAEGPADDGHSWRKYGQKDILGAKHPRAYYRCTHRNSQNCPATKQVQRTDDHPALFDVVYHGEHICRPGGGSGSAKWAQQQHNPHAQAALQGLSARLTVATTTTADAAAIGAAAALPPMTPESCPVRGASSPWSLASPVGSDSNGCLHQGVSPCPVPGYRDWASDLQEVVSSAFAAVSSAAPLPVLDDEFMSLECFGFDQNFEIDTAMPSLYYP
ncbi:unnamed protein product [Miscanthus lutarioriparius]|uniref:WRKY domain-containing protein n=1 Tax=Miscanthus lutarioriparius TaxID=422564 RepID=A0A811PI67_9POAL|nr:unnamed protein product [Miscanthus lutarioriparius]